MDVGNPSNFWRMLDLFDGDYAKLNSAITGYSFDDEMTAKTMKDVYAKSGYILDPHGAVGYAGLKKFKSEQRNNAQGIFLETAHPAKFIDVVERILNIKVPLPEELKDLEKLPGKSTKMSTSYEDFKEFMLTRKV